MASPSAHVTYIKGLVRRLGLLNIRGHDCGIVDPTSGWRGKVGTWESGTEVDGFAGGSRYRVTSVAAGEIQARGNPSTNVPQR